MLEHIIKNKYRIEEKTKLEVRYKKHKMFALSEVLIHNQNPRSGVRMKVYVDGRVLHPGEVIGDGLLVATQFGSTGYYKSITRSYFESDSTIGLAFNNAIDQVNHIVLNQERVIRVKITRGPAEVFADNQPESFVLDRGEELEISVSPSRARVIKLV